MMVEIFDENAPARGEQQVCLSAVDGLCERMTELFEGPMLHLCELPLNHSSSEGCRCACGKEWTCTRLQ